MKLGLGLSLPSMQRRRDTLALDPDALAYITAVEAADGEALEAGVREAINGFVVGCKADGIWDALKASCILAGARTLNGALVPLKGAAPTNFNFVSADYSRTLGLQGNGATKTLNSNYTYSTQEINNHHAYFYASDGRVDAETGARSAMGDAGSTTDSVQVNSFSSGLNARSMTATASVTALTAAPTGFGLSRSASDNYNVIADGVVTNQIIGSSSRRGSPMFVFSRDNAAHYDRKGSFYSIGEALDLAALDTRVTALMTALDGAIA